MALNAFADQAAALDTVTIRCSGGVDMGVSRTCSPIKSRKIDIELMMTTLQEKVELS